MKGLFFALLFSTLLVSAEDIALCEQGWSVYQYGDYEKSVALFNQCIDQGDLSQATLAQTYRNMGIVSNGSGYSREAIKYYQKAIDLKPSEVWYDYVNMGNAFSNLGEFQKSIENYQKALELKPHFNEAYYNMGLVYDRMSKVELAVKNYQLALDHGLNTPQLMERVNQHNIKIEKNSFLSNVSIDSETNAYQPAKGIKEVARFDSYTCQSFVGRGFKSHPQSESIKKANSYTFTEHNIEFKLPNLPLSHFTMADHLNNKERRVKDSYLVFVNDLMGDVGAAVVVTEFPPNYQEQNVLMNFTKQLEKGLASNFSLRDVLIRELDSDYGSIIELMAYNRGASACFPTSEFTHSPEDKETMGISRFVYKGNIMIELALIVEKPDQMPSTQLADHARKQMDQFWSGLVLN